MMADRAAWTGNATRLYVALAPSLELMGKKGSPARARDLAVKLRRAGPLLRKIGIEIRFERQGHGRERMISISAALDAAEPNTLSGPLAPSVSKTTPASSASSAKQDDLRSEGAVGTNADARASWDKADDADASTQ